MKFGWAFKKKKKNIYIYILGERDFSLFIFLIIQKPIFFNWTKFVLIQV